MTQALGDWLRANALAELEAIFVDNEVDLKTLKILTDSDLKELGLAFGPRKRILDAIAQLRRQDGCLPGEADRPSPTETMGERR